MPIPANFNGRRLQRHAWTIPFKLSFAPVALIAIVVATPVVAEYPAVLFEPVFLATYLWETMTPWPFGIAAFLSLLAFMKGISFGSTGRQYLNRRMDVRELAPTEPLALRVHRIAEALQLPLPRVGIMPTANAYAIGSSVNDAAVVIGRPLMQHLSEAELDAVIGHELGHIVSGDMKRMQMAAGYQSMVQDFLDRMIAYLDQIVRAPSKYPFAGLAAWIAGHIFRAIALFVSEVLVKRLSKSREYVADAFGAMASTPEAMISALAKLHGIDPPQPTLSKAHQNLMFWSAGNSLFSTHPTFEKRVAALEKGAKLARLLKRGGRHGAVPASTADPATTSTARQTRSEKPVQAAAKPSLYTSAKPADSNGPRSTASHYADFETQPVKETIAAPPRAPLPTWRRHREEPIRADSAFTQLLIDCSIPALVILSGLVGFYIVFQYA